jgi:hypothetical protein
MVERSKPYPAMLVGLPRGFTRQRFFEHYAYGQSYLGRTPTMNEFRRSLRKLRRGTPRYGFFFVRGIPGEATDALAEHYAPVSERMAGRPYRALLPKELVR